MKKEYNFHASHEQRLEKKKALDSQASAEARINEVLEEFDNENYDYRYKHTDIELKGDTYYVGYWTQEDYYNDGEIDLAQELNSLNLKIALLYVVRDKMGLVTTFFTVDSIVAGDKVRPGEEAKDIKLVDAAVAAHPLYEKLSRRVQELADTEEDEWFSHSVSFIQKAFLASTTLDDMKALESTSESDLEDYIDDWWGDHLREYDV